MKSQFVFDAGKRLFFWTKVYGVELYTDLIFPNEVEFHILRKELCV